MHTTFCIDINDIILGSETGLLPSRFLPTGLWCAGGFWLNPGRKPLDILIQRHFILLLHLPETLHASGIPFPQKTKTERKESKKGITLEKSISNRKVPKSPIYLGKAVC